MVVDDQRWSAQQKDGLPRRCAPRNDELQGRVHVTFVGVHAIPAVEQCVSAFASLRVQT
jgi:hypothetical protein